MTSEPPWDEFASRRIALWCLLGAWVAVTALLTLTPSGYTRPLTLRDVLCVGCGRRDLADGILNWAWFVPGGLLGAMALGKRRAVGLAICFSAAIEAIQVGIPGRDPALQDLAANALGAVSGALVISRGLGGWGQRLLATVAGIAWLAPLVLLAPRTSPEVLHGLWTPQFGNVAHYEGRILGASVGRVDVPSHLVPENDALDSALVTRQPIRVSLEVGPPPPTPAPVFQINDHRRRETLVLAAVGPDLILWSRNRATVLTLDEPDVRWDGALRGLLPGDTATVVVTRGRDSVCMWISTAERCGLAPSLSEGWGLLLYPESSPAWLRSVFAVLWAVGLGVILGATSPRSRRAVLAAVLLGLVGYAAAHATPDVRPDWLGSATLVVGALLGVALRAPVIRLWATLRRATPAGPRRTSPPT